MTLPEKLKYYRKKAGLSQTQVSDALYLSRQTVSRWESGVSVPTVDNLAALSKLYNTPMDILANEDATPLSVQDSSEEGNPRDPSSEKRSPLLGRKVLRILFFTALALLFLVVGILIGRHTGTQESFPLPEKEYQIDLSEPHGNFDIEW